MVDTEKYIRKPLYVDAVRVTNANFDEIAAWCQGEVLQDYTLGGGVGKKYIKVRVHNPKVPRQTRAYVGDWLLYTERGYKVYTNKAFHASFDLVEGVAPKTETELPTRLGNVSYSPEEKDQLAAQQLDTPLSEDEEVAEAEPVSEMAQAVAMIEAEGGTVEEATPEGIADAVAQNEAAREERFEHTEEEPKAALPVPEGKTVISEKEQAEMDPEEIRELIQSGEYILAQDLVA